MNMEPHPKISVLITTYNRVHLLGKTIDSVFRQTFKNYEIIVLDDGSTDNTEHVMRELQIRDSRIRYIKYPHTGLPSVVSNYGLLIARGEYVAILDDDDMWADPEKLEKQTKFLDEHEEHVGCGGGAIVVDENGKEQTRYLKPTEDEDIRRVALIADPMINSTTLFRNSVAKQIGHYDTTITHYADWDFWLKMAKHGKLYNFHEYFIYYRIWGGSSSFAKHTPKHAIWSSRIVCRHRKYYPGFSKAITLAFFYYLYSFLPMPVKQLVSPTLSKLKKMVFQK